MKNHNHDLVHEISELMDSIWRMDQYIQNAQGCEHCTSLWQGLKGSLSGNVDQLKQEIIRHVQENRFD